LVVKEAYLGKIGGTWKMDKLVRLARLSLLVEAAGGQVEGRKKLHKLAYLCQRAGTDLGHGFAFHMYGVYSPSLPQDVEAAEAWGYITEKVNAKAGKYDIALDAKGRNHEKEAEAPNEVGFELVRKLANESPTTLEVLTTIVYLWDAGYRDQKLHEKLHDVKGHLAAQFGHSFELAQRHALTAPVVTPVPH
jgi:hypothetical protein